VKRTVRFLGFAALVLIAVGAVGYAAGDRSRGGEATFPGVNEIGAPDDLMARIDRSLGREPASLPPLKAPEPFAAGGSSGDSASRPSAEAGPAGAPSAAIQDGDRKIVQTASIRLQVREVGVSFEEVGRVATAAGGFVASSNFSYQGDQQVASVTIRVPANRYQDVLSSVRGLGVRVDAEASNASDITEEYSDLSARLRTLEATESQLLQLLARANTIAEILQVQDRLNSVRTEIERVKGRMNLLDNLAEMATITVHLRPAVGTARTGTGIDLGAEIREAWDNSLEFLAGVLAGVISVVVFSWWVFVLAIPTFFLFQRWLRSRPQPPAPAA
jgi:hypothetical protein